MATSAVLGSSRLANFRLGYVPATTATLRRSRIKLLLAGTDITLLTSTTRTLVGSVTVHDALNDTPNTASFRVKGTAPTVGQSVRITVGADTSVLLFTGTVQTVEMSYVGTSTVEWNVTATDDLARLNQRRPFGTWTNVSATTIAQSLITTYAPGFTSVNVQASLPAISLNLDGSEGFSGALKQIAQLIGGYFYVEDLDLHLFTSEATNAPDAVDATHKPLDDPPISMTTDLSQIRTRVYGKGHGEATPTDVLAGDTVLPVANTEMFNPFGGQAIAETQRLTYTGLQAVPTGGGSLVGPGASPSTAPSGSSTGGTAVGVGDNKYVYTYITAAGESLPSPAGTITTYANHPAPTGAVTYGGFIVGAQADGFYGYAYTFVDGTGETTAGPRVVFHNSAGLGADLESIAAGLTGVTARNIYRTTAQATAGAALTAQLKFLGTKAGNGAGGYADVYNDSVLGANVPTVNTAAAYRNPIVTGISIGPTGTTNRKLYRFRSGVNGSVYHLLDLGGIGDNTTTTYTDTTADATIAAHLTPPVADTSGLTVQSGQVLAGSTSIETASSFAFSATGGWALIGSQAVRYTGITGNTLTGVPASGAGSLISTVRFGEHIDPAPALTGVSGIVVDIPSGTTVNIWVQRDDPAAQTAMAALDGTAGIYEYLVSDERRNEASLIALCDANLILYSRPTVTVTYATRDVKTKSGKPVTINTTNPTISQTLTIQDVNISEISIAATLLPKFTVTASNVRFSLESVLRQLIGKAA